MRYARLGVEEAEGAAIHLARGAPLHLSAYRGMLAVSVRDPKWLLAAGDWLGH
jgi:hypothetical protein